MAELSILAAAGGESDAAIAERLDHPLTEEGMPHEGTEALTTEAGAVHHAEPAVFGLNATVWVSIAMLVLIAIIVAKKVPAAIGRALDKKIDGIRTQLAEAKTLRGEAEALKAKYEARLNDAEAEAADIRAAAEKDAAAHLAAAQAETETLIARRRKMAEDKIAAAERQAVDALRAKVATAATAAAERLIAANHGADADRALVDKAIRTLN